MEICPANFPEDNRRYYHIKLHKGTFFGTKEPCNSETTVLELNKYYSYLPTFQCPYCFCLCEESHTLSSDRYINLRISMVNISDNR
ncbi:hypothetical protein TcasGA2_TC033906 [Tribolium castaneum]|uniref:Uncharacterized protein n=3 Tax=Tribolium castaneum TaxID=7070 RepID=A0A139W998_TRICA|nr:hypothetical protein TcasGA2_TC033906 [Tribolium castaneum]